MPHIVYRSIEIQRQKKKCSCPSKIKTSPLFNMWSILSAKDDQKSKAQIFKFYFTKGGTDLLDQLIDHYSTRAKSLRWVMVAFSYMLDTALVNSKTVWCLKENIHKLNSHDFGWSLAKSFAMHCLSE